MLHEPIYEYLPEYKDLTVAVTDSDGNVHVEKAKNPMLIKHAFTMMCMCGMPYYFGNSNGSVWEFGWTEAAGTYVSIDPSEGVSIVYMHQMFRDMKVYHHLRVRAVANGCLV